MLALIGFDRDSMRAMGGGEGDLGESNDWDESAAWVGVGGRSEQPFRE